MRAIIAICVCNRLADLSNDAVRQRLSRGINLEGPDCDLVVGQKYVVQAIEERAEGWCFYVHSVAQRDYPYPYPAEYFRIVTNDIPDWCIRVKLTEVEYSLKLISFSQWANDDAFYEKLIDGDRDALLVYEQAKIRTERDPLAD